MNNGSFLHGFSSKSEFFFSFIVFFFRNPALFFLSCRFPDITFWVGRFMFHFPLRAEMKRESEATSIEESSMATGNPNPFPKGPSRGTTGPPELCLEPRVPNARKVAFQNPSTPTCLPGSCLMPQVCLVRVRSGWKPRRSGSFPDSGSVSGLPT